MRSALPLLAFLAVVACSAVSRVDPGDMADPGRYALQVGTESPAAGYRRFLLDEQEKPDPYDQFRRDARQPLCVSWKLIARQRGGWRLTVYRLREILPRKRRRVVMRKILQSVVILVALAVCSCGGGAKQLDGGTYDGAPEWYDNPTKGCGVGSVKYRGIKDLARKTAIAAAREELAAQLKAVTQGMVKNYQQQGETDAQPFTEELQTRVSREVVDQTMVGSRVAATALRGEEFYSMVCLDPETFADAFDRMKSLSGKQREALKSRAKAEFADLDVQIEKFKAGQE